MLIHYINKKENKDKILANDIYIYIIANIQLIFKKKEINIKKDFNSTFELISVYLFVFFYSYKSSIKNSNINQLVMNIFINDLDKSLRELGIGDMSIGKYVKSYVKKFYFRLSKLEKIFELNNFDEFSKYLETKNIHMKNSEFEIISKYLFNNIENLIKIAETKDIYNFDFKLLPN